MALIYAMQAMLGFGDDHEDLKHFQRICIKGFQRVKEIGSLDDITVKRKDKCPYIEADEYFPDNYTVEMLAYTENWRTTENIKMLADEFNNINAVMKPENEMAVKIKGRYMAPCFALIHPIRAFRTDLIDTINYRRLLTEIAMMGVGERADVIRESADNVREAIYKDGILRLELDRPHNKRYSPLNIKYPTPYVDIRLESDYKDKKALLCDLTYWAVEFLHFCENSL